MSSFQNVFELLPAELHEIIQRSLSLWDCVNMSQVSRHTNKIWKKFIDNTPNKRLDILKHIIMNTKCPTMAQDRMFIERIMSSDLIWDLKTGDQVGYFRSEVFLIKLLESMLFSMTNITHLERVFDVFDENMSFLGIRRDMKKYYDIVYEHISKYGLKIWHIDLLADVTNWVIPRLRSCGGHVGNPIRLHKLIRCDNCVENVHKLATLLNIGKPGFPSSQGLFYKGVIDYIGNKLSSTDLINLVQKINIEDFINSGVIINVFNSILGFDEQRMVKIQLEKAIKVWKGIKMEVRLAIFETVLHYAVTNWPQFADFLWNEERLSMKMKTDSLTTDQIYKILTDDDSYVSEIAHHLNWINNRLGPVFTPDLLVKAIEHSNHCLVSALLKNDKIDINKSYMGKTPLQRMYTYPSSAEKIDEYIGTFSTLLAHRNLNWTSETKGMLNFFNSLAFNNTNLINDLKENEKFRNTFKLIRKRSGEYYHVTLLNPSKKQKL